MEVVEDYEYRGQHRQELGEKVGDGYWVYEGGTLSIYLPGDLSLKKCTNLRINLGGSQTTSARSVQVTVPGGYGITGDLAVTGDAQITGNLTVSGNLDVHGSITSGGSITATGDVKGAGISLANHTHQGAHGRTSPPS